MRTSPTTLVLTRKQIEPLLDKAVLLTALREAFAAYSMSRQTPARRFPVPLPAPSPAGAGVMLLAPGLIEGVPAYSVKVHAKFPGQEPAIQGVIILHDILTGHPLTILESTLITAVRTGLAGALAADVLARRDASRAAIIGAGAQGALQLESHMAVRRLASVSVFDTSLSKAEAFAERESGRLGVSVRPAASVAEAVAEADIIVAATWAADPFLFPGMVKPGCHITTLGPDQPGKCEVSADLIRQSFFVCDDRDLAVEMGAIGGANLTGDAIHAELGEIIAGAKRGRVSSEQITVFGGVGLAFQDLAAAWAVFQRALADGVGTPVGLLA
jgi:ornithine cyclodeaminase/alanine dehydrogenase-like protein (mu-crystallin family)